MLPGVGEAEDRRQAGTLVKAVWGVTGSGAGGAGVEREEERRQLFPEVGQ